jgi:putative transposase
MSRRRRPREAGVVQHVMNRGNRKNRIFHEDDDYWLFMQLLATATRRFNMRLLAYCVMPNHWHLVVWPSVVSAVPAYMHWLTSTHVRRYHRAHDLVGTGHLYQGPYTSVAVQSDSHVLTVLRYVEGNPVRAGLVQRAEEWPWSSVSEMSLGFGRFTSDGPLPRPKNWRDHVNSTANAIARLRRAIRLSEPFGTPAWTLQTAERLAHSSNAAAVDEQVAGTAHTAAL